MLCIKSIGEGYIGKKGDGKNFDKMKRAERSAGEEIEPHGAPTKTMMF